jgi:hypothetical protein
MIKKDRLKTADIYNQSLVITAEFINDLSIPLKERAQIAAKIVVKGMPQDINQYTETSVSLELSEDIKKLLQPLLLLFRDLLKREDDN